MDDARRSTLRPPANLSLQQRPFSLSLRRMHIVDVSPMLSTVIPSHLNSGCLAGHTDVLLDVCSQGRYVKKERKKIIIIIMIIMERGAWT